MPTPTPSPASQKTHHVVVIGGGFGGLHVTRQLANVKGLSVTLIDKRNFHLFQPLLYQVATGGLSPNAIASPLRHVFRRAKNVTTLLADVKGIDPTTRTVRLSDGHVTYDTLVVATGSKHHYFGNNHFEENAPGLKTLEDALDMRHRVLLAFEAAEREPDPEKRQAWLNFVIVGGGPTGVELAGSIAELAHRTLRKDFRRINPADTNITIVEGSDRVLPVYGTALSASARKALAKLKVNVIAQSLVTDIQPNHVTIKHRQGNEETLTCRTVLWAAGVKASSLGQKLATATGAEVDRIGRVIVNQHLALPVANHIFVVGDLANYTSEATGQPLPGVAPVAMQQGAYVGKLIKHQHLTGEMLPPFKYNDKGSMAVIGKNKAVAKIGKVELSGFVAWLLWVSIHVVYLVEFDNRIAVAFDWLVNYFFRKRTARLITVKDPFPLCDVAAQEASPDASTSTSKAQPEAATA
jgi:NADH dehydrogenase